MAEFDDLVNKFAHILNDRFPLNPNYVRGLLGDGQGNVVVPGRTDHHYVRVNRSSTETWEVFNKATPPTENLPVIVGSYPWTPTITQVVSEDWSAYLQKGWGNSYANNTAHAESHAWADAPRGPSSDPLTVYLRAIQPLATRAGGSGSTSVFVQPYEFSTSGSWGGVPPLDLSTIIGAMTTGTARYAGVYHDQETNTLGVVTGTTTIDAPAITPKRPTWPVDATPSSYVRLHGGQGAITERDIVDARRIYGVQTQFVPLSEFTTAATSDGLDASNLVNIYSDRARKASNSGDAAHGFVSSSYASGTTATITLAGILETSGLTPGAEYYLGTDGALIDTATGTAIRQHVGYALSSTKLFFNRSEPEEL